MKLLRICWESAENLLRIFWESAENLLRIWWESAENLLRLCCESAENLMRVCRYIHWSMLTIHWESFQNLLIICWELADTYTEVCWQFTLLSLNHELVRISILKNSANHWKERISSWHKNYHPHFCSQIYHTPAIWQRVGNQLCSATSYIYSSSWH